MEIFEKFPSHLILTNGEYHFRLYAMGAGKFGPLFYLATVGNRWKTFKTLSGAEKWLVRNGMKG